MLLMVGSGFAQGLPPGWPWRRAGALWRKSREPKNKSCCAVLNALLERPPLELLVDLLPQRHQRLEKVAVPVIVRIQQVLHPSHGLDNLHRAAPHGAKPVCINGIRQRVGLCLLLPLWGVGGGE